MRQRDTCQNNWIAAICRNSLNDICSSYSHIFTRYVMDARPGYQCGDRQTATSFFIPAKVRWGWELSVGHLVLIPHHSLECARAIASCKVWRQFLTFELVFGEVSTLSRNHQPKVQSSMRLIQLTDERFDGAFCVVRHSSSGTQISKGSHRFNRTSALHAKRVVWSAPVKMDFTCIFQNNKCAENHV